MKFTADCKEFYDALNFIQRGVAARTTMPIISNVLVVVNEKIQLRSTNLVISLRTTFNSNIKETGSVVISPNQLLSLLSVNSGEVKVSVEKMMSVRAGNGQIRLGTMDAAEFPIWPEINPMLTLEVDKNLIKKAFNSVEFAVAKDARRPILTGTYLNAQHNLIVGADGIRLAMTSYDELRGDFDVVITQQGIEEAKRITTLSDEKLMQVQIGEKFSYFKVGEYEVIANHLAGGYPTAALGVAEKIKSRDHDAVVVLKKDSLLKVLGVANTFQTGLLTVPFRLTCEDRIVAEIETDAGSYKDVVEGKIERGQISILLSPSHIIDIANQVGGDEVILQMGTPHQPILVLDPSNENWLVIQVPIADKEGIEKWEKEKEAVTPQIESKDDF